MASHWFIVFAFFVHILTLSLARSVTEDINFHPNRKLLPSLFQCGVGRKVPPCASRHNFHVRGGHCDAQPGDFPWMADIHNFGKSDYGTYSNHLCGGFVINERYVLSAAHCFTAPIENQEWYRVYVGGVSNDISNTDWSRGRYQAIDVECLVIHERFYRGPYQNDIALVRLTRPIQFSDFVQPICLPLSEPLKRLPTDGKEMTIAGWGDIWRGQFTNTLKYDEVPVVPIDTCIKRWREDIPNLLEPSFHSTVICAGDRITTCQGDSGGPLTMAYPLAEGLSRSFVFGIVSLGPKCNATAFNPEAKPSVFTKVASFLPWILDHICE